MAKEPLLCPVRPPAGRATVYTNSANGLTRAAQPYTIPCRRLATERASELLMLARPLAEGAPKICVVASKQLLPEDELSLRE